MAVRPILLLGNPALHAISTPVTRGEVPRLLGAIRDLHDTMVEFQRAHGWGRAIAAPQIGVPRRIVAMNDTGPLTFINPVLSAHSEETVEIWEDCMSFPELLVRLRNPRSCRLTYRDPDWTEHTVELSDDYAELLQHEVDHLDGVLAVERAIDGRSIVLRRAMPEGDRTLRGAFRPLG